LYCLRHTAPPLITTNTTGSEREEAVVRMVSIRAGCTPGRLIEVLKQKRGTRWGSECWITCGKDNERKINIPLPVLPFLFLGLIDAHYQDHRVRTIHSTNGRLKALCAVGIDITPLMVVTQTDHGERCVCRM
jgi:hypothetical protein